MTKEQWDELLGTIKRINEGYKEIKAWQEEHGSLGLNLEECYIDLGDEA